MINISHVIITEHFFVSNGYNTMKGLLNVTWDADEINTFRLGYLSSNDPAECEARCRLKTECFTYTYYSIYYPEEAGDSWQGECMGRTDYVNVNVSDVYATSGKRLTTKPSGKYLKKYQGVCTV